MLSIVNYWEEVEFMREHELLELFILKNEFLKADELNSDNIENLRETTENFHLKLISQYSTYIHYA